MDILSIIPDTWRKLPTNRTRTGVIGLGNEWRRRQSHQKLDDARVIVRMNFIGRKRWTWWTMSHQDDFISVSIGGNIGPQRVCGSLPRVARYVGRDYKRTKEGSHRIIISRHDPFNGRVWDGARIPSTNGSSHVISACSLSADVTGT